MKPRPIILCSGGIDSLALTVMAVTRNLNPMLLHMLIAAALNASQDGDYDQIWIGCTKEDDEHYWDCRESFIQALNILIKDGVGVAAPLINMTRKQVLMLIPEPIQYLAWSCYQPYCGVPCGRCNSCVQGKE